MRPYYPAFRTFTKELLRSHEDDPAYPILRWLGRGVSIESHLWLTTLYLAYVSVPIAYAVWSWHPLPTSLPARALRLPIDTDRRGLRGGRASKHIDAYLAAIASAPSQHAWLTQGWDDNPEANYERFWVQSQTLWGNGRWAAFKWAETLRMVHDLPLAAPDMRLAQCRAPVAGLRDLCGLSAQTSLAQLDKAGSELRAWLTRDGCPCLWEQLETALCNWHSLRKGRLYIGLTIDTMQRDILTSPLTPRLMEHVFRARAETLPQAYLGEIHGWSGPQPQLMDLYARTGVIHVR